MEKSFFEVLGFLEFLGIFTVFFTPGEGPRENLVFSPAYISATKSRKHMVDSAFES